MLMEDITTISLERKTKEKLENLGNKKDTYDDIVNMLIESHLEKK